MKNQEIPTNGIGLFRFENSRTGTALALAVPQVHESGSVLAEFAIVLGFLLLIVLSAFDFGGLLQQYFTLSQVAFEGARSASIVAGLHNPEVLAVVPTEEQLEECAATLDDPRAISKNSCALIVGYFRIQKLLTMYGYSSSRVAIKLSFDEKKQIRCAISKPFDALFPFYRLVSVSASTEIPYFGAK